MITIIFVLIISKGGTKINTGTLTKQKAIKKIIDGKPGNYGDWTKIGKIEPIKVKPLIPSKRR